MDAGTAGGRGLGVQGAVAAGGEGGEPIGSTDEEVKGQDERGGKHCSCGRLEKIVAIVEQDAGGHTYGQPTTAQESDLPSGGDLNVTMFTKFGLSPSAKPDLSSGSSS